MLLGRSADWYPWLRLVILVTGLGGAVLLLVARQLPGAVARAVAGLALFAVLAGPAAYALDTAATVHSGAIPSAGPMVAGVRFGGFAGGRPGPGGFAAGPPAGGLLTASSPGSALLALLDNSRGYRWAAATVGANSAAGYQLATGAPVLAIGGFNGSDPAPTLARFQQWVAAHRIHYFISGGGMPGGRGAGPGGTSNGTAQQIEEWVAANYTATTVGGVTVYELS